MWDGDVLQITGSEGNDFIAVQQDELGLKVFTEDAVFTEYGGRSFDTASSVDVFGQGGNDVLFSYHTDIPVSLNGGGGNDFLYSDKETDVLDGGDGFDWIQSTGLQGSSEDAFGIPGLNPNSGNLTVTPQLDDDGRIGLHVEVAGEINVAGQAIDVTGGANVSSDGVAVAVTGAVSVWNDAFGIDGFNLFDTSLTISAGTDVLDGNGYRVDVTSSLHVSGTDIGIDGSVDVHDEATSAAFTGTVANWDDAFGIDGLDLTNAELTGSGSIDADDNQTFILGISADLRLENTVIEVSGSVNLEPDRIDAAFSGTAAYWDDAFGIAGLDLTDSEINVAAYSDRQDDYALHVAVEANLQVEDTAIGVSGSVDITPEQIDAVFSGAVEDWDDAFGIDGFDLLDSEISVVAFSNRQDDYDLRVDLFGDLNIQGTLARVEGSLDIEPDRVEATLTGSVAANWNNAFGIAGLTLRDTRLSVNAVRDDEDGNSLGIDLAADLNVSGTDVDVAGQVDITPNGVSGSLTGVVAGTWTSAFGIAPLHLHDTTLSIAGSKTSSGSELSIGVTSGLNLLGTDLGISGTVDVTPEGVRATLTGSVAGEWVDAFGVPGLDLRDTAVSLSAGTDSAGFDIELDTDLQLFGGYIDVIGDLGISPTGIDLTFSPPASIGFTDLLGIPGFTLDDADLTVTVGTDGLEVAVSSTFDLGIDIEFEGAFSVSRNEVQASLTGRVAEWNNAFDVPGLNLNDVVLTLGAESGIGGASLYIGLGAGIEIGDSELSVAGLVGFGATGWEVAFRGSIDSLKSDDLIDFANTLNQAGDPDSAVIPDGALGDLELREAYINFAPYGGHEALGITDGFGIGAAFYDDGRLIGSGEFIVDLANGVFEAGLDVPKFDLGPVELSDVVIDIRLAPTDSHYHVAGKAELLGAEVALEGKVSSNSFSLQGSAAVDMAGLSASVTFIVDQNGIRFVATSGGGAINAVKDGLTSGIRAVANVAQAAIDKAQEGVDLAGKAVANLEADLAEARAEAQKKVDKIKADIDKAKVVVDSALAARNSLAKSKSAAYTAWRKAVSATRNAAWYNRPYYKAREVAKYASYATVSVRHAAQVAVYNAANVTYNAVRAAAGWAMDAAGVEANPKVISIKALLAVANAGVDAAELVLNGVEAANAGVLQALKQIDSVRVNRITIEGNVSDFRNSGLKVTLDYSIGRKNYKLSVNATADNLVEQLGRELLAAVL